MPRKTVRTDIDTQCVDDAIRYVNKHVPLYEATKCALHKNRLCFSLLSLVDHRYYHALMDSGAKEWVPFYPNDSQHCQIPLFCHHLRLLFQKMGSDFVLPLSSTLQDARGRTAVLYEVPRQIYGPVIIGDAYLTNVFVGYMVYLCYVSRFCGGIVPSLNSMKFVYAPTHPLCADVGSQNVANRTPYKEKKWLHFMHHTKARLVIAFTMCIFPQFCTKRRGKRCRLSDQYTFNDESHRLLCKSTHLSLFHILKHMVSLDSPFGPYILDLVELAENDAV